MNDYCVYMHINILNGKKYCGITKDINVRWRNNGIAYKPYDGCLNRPFWNAIQKYGFDKFKHEIIYENLTFEQACKLEKYMIAKLHLQNRLYGYNVAEGGNGGKIYLNHPKGMQGKHHTKEHNKHQSDIMKNHDRNCMTNGSCVWGVTHNHPKGMLGKHHTEERKKEVQKQFSKKIKVITSTGEEMIFDSIGKTAETLGLNPCTVGKWSKLNKPIHIDVSHPKLMKYDGYYFVRM